MCLKENQIPETVSSHCNCDVIYLMNIAFTSRSLDKIAGDVSVHIPVTKVTTLLSL